MAKFPSIPTSHSDESDILRYWSKEAKLAVCESGLCINNQGYLCNHLSCNPTSWYEPSRVIGSNLTAIVTNSKQYISELGKNSFTLQKLNEQFRHIAPRLDIVSFYETQSTSIGNKSARIVSRCWHKPF